MLRRLDFLRSRIHHTWGAPERAEFVLLAKNMCVGTLSSIIFTICIFSNTSDSPQAALTVIVP